MAIVAAAITCGAFVAVTQVSEAGTRFGFGNRRGPTCPPTAPGGATTGPVASTNTPQTTTQNGRTVRQWPGDQGDPNTRIRRRGDRDRCVPTNPPAPTTTGSGGTSGTPSAPPTLEAGPSNCDGSNLQAHNGFQAEGRCVSTVLGEVGTVANSPTAIIVEAPDEVAVNTPFSVVISTRNLLRTRFLAAAAGGYYLEAPRLDSNGLVIGHAHFGCSILPSDDEAPPPTRSVVFQAIEDGGGSANADRLTINLPGVPTAGTLRCGLWSGSNSHALPAAPFANMMPAFDTVRIEVG
jgi:hypothetical protein